MQKLPQRLVKIAATLARHPRPKTDRIVERVPQGTIRGSAWGPTGDAVANAVDDLIGIPLRHLPRTPDVIYRRLPAMTDRAMHRVPAA